MKKLSVLIFLSSLVSNVFAGALCDGKFVNPITDVCWKCLFPLTIGSAKVISGSYPDTTNPSSIIGICRIGVLWRIGLNIGYWEPAAMAETVRKPYCMVNLGGMQLPMGTKAGIGGKHTAETGAPGFYYAHWYQYPLISWLKILSSMACMQTGDFDIAYLTELDPTWNDSEWAFILNPEAILFGNHVAQLACAADSVATASGQLPIDKLFWCAGSHGSMYPFSGFVNDENNPIQTSILLAERLDYKMHRQEMILESRGENFPCTTRLAPIMPKSRYRYQMVNTVKEGNACHPFGYTVAAWSGFHNYPSSFNQFGWLIWRKRNCVFL